MAQDLHGMPFWFELGTPDRAAAARFYEPLFGWTVEDSGMPEMEYHLARDGAAMVAGMMPVMGPEGTPPNWLVYFGVRSIDETAAEAERAGGTVLVPVQMVPGTGRFAVLADPTGAVFGILEPEPMDSPADPADAAWNPQKAGRGNWLELMSADPGAAFDFYARLFGWTKGDAMEMGDQGTYQMFTHQGSVIGGMMGLMGAPMSYWLPYFGVDAPVSAVMEEITARSGTVQTGPIEVPGPAYIAVAQDPQGAWFAVVGAEK